MSLSLYELDVCQARTQTFEKGSASFGHFAQGERVCFLRK